MIEVRRAVPADADRLAALAWRTAGLPGSERHRFAATGKRSEIERDDVVTLLAADTGEPVGYLQLRTGAAPSCVDGARPVQLWRIYVDSSWHGRGVAQALLAAAATEATAMDAGVVWLGVEEDNFRARQFYEKSGFRLVGSAPCHDGDDLIYRCELSQLGTTRETGD